MFYTADEIITRIKQLPSFKYIPQNYWICGIRNAEDHPDKFDDRFYLFKGQELILDTSGTTNAGLSILQGGFKKYNNEGAAILGADEFYYDVWTFGKHLGKVEALLQRGAKMKVFRDGNMNHLSEEEGDPEWDFFGINFHPDQMSYEKDERPNDRGVGGYSAGCQVANIFEDYKRFIEAGRTQRFVSYCLLNEFSI